MLIIIIKLNKVNYPNIYGMLLAYKPDKVTELNQYYAHIEESAKNINVTPQTIFNITKDTRNGTKKFV
jgi:hypothetical protein